MKQVSALFKGTVGTLGWVIGICIFSLIIYLVNTTRGNDATAKVDAYMRDRDTFELAINSFKWNLGYVKGGITKGGFSYYSYADGTFYDTQCKKYFRLVLFGTHMHSQLFSSFLDNVKDGDNIKALVNKAELNDTSYGTVQKPVPVFYLELETGDWRKIPDFFKGSSEKDNSAEMKQMFWNSVWVYLKFVKSKKDFDAMFYNLNLKMESEQEFQFITVDLKHNKELLFAGLQVVDSIIAPDIIDR